MTRRPTPTVEEMAAQIGRLSRIRAYVTDRLAQGDLRYNLLSADTAAEQKTNNLVACIAETPAISTVDVLAKVLLGLHALQSINTLPTDDALQAREDTRNIHLAQELLFDAITALENLSGVSTLQLGLHDFIQPVPSSFMDAIEAEMHEANQKPSGGLWGPIRQILDGTAPQVSDAAWADIFAKVSGKQPDVTDLGSWDDIRGRKPDESIH